MLYSQNEDVREAIIELDAQGADLIIIDHKQCDVEMMDHIFDRVKQYLGLTLGLVLTEQYYISKNGPKVPILDFSSLRLKSSSFILDAIFDRALPDKYEVVVESKRYLEALQLSAQAAEYAYQGTRLEHLATASHRSVEAYIESVEELKLYRDLLALSEEEKNS